MNGIRWCYTIYLIFLVSILYEDCKAQELLGTEQSHRKLQATKNSDGPWPECLGMQGEDCIAFIESQAEDVYGVIVYPREYDYHRIWMYVDEKDIVKEPPGRG